MKKRLAAVVAMGCTLLVTNLALAQTRDQGVNDRQRNQERRIEQGRHSGQLTPREYRQLGRQQTHIRRMEQRMYRDGRFTYHERARLHHKQNQASRNIYCKKHNRRYYH